MTAHIGHYRHIAWPKSRSSLAECDKNRRFMFHVRYVENAAFPKDVVILMDRSGSMKGVRLEIARSTVEKILSTLTDDDYFNVITVAHTHLC